MKELIFEARKAMEKAYAPYSKFNVGAAVLMKDGKIYSGSNVENSSYGLSMCAERNAIFKAVNDGYRMGDFKAILILSHNDDFLPPCGACRQVMSEFLKIDAPVYLANAKDEVKEYTLNEILPLIFSGDDIK